MARFLARLCPVLFIRRHLKDQGYADLIAILALPQCNLP